jgi:hypothetical protein
MGLGGLELLTLSLVEKTAKAVWPLALAVIAYLPMVKLGQSATRQAQRKIKARSFLEKLKE